MFVDEENIVVEGTIKEVRGGNGPAFSFFTVIPYDGQKVIRLIIGASPDNECAAHFNKGEIGDLIKILRKIRKAMKE